MKNNIIIIVRTCIISHMYSIAHLLIGVHLGQYTSIADYVDRAKMDKDCALGHRCCSIGLIQAKVMYNYSEDRSRQVIHPPSLLIVNVNTIIYKVSIIILVMLVITLLWSQCQLKSQINYMLHVPLHVTHPFATKSIVLYNYFILIPLTSCSFQYQKCL